MNKIKNVSIAKPNEARLEAYSKLSRAVLLQPFKNPQSLFPLGAAFLAGIPASEAAIVYSGTQNVAVNIPINFNRVAINLNGAGGNDFEMQNNEVAGVKFIQANELVGADFAINGFIANLVSPYAYPLANNAGFVIGAGGPWGFGVGERNTMADDHPSEAQYPGTQWETNGMTRFIGFSGSLSGGTKYGWIRIRRNTHTSWTIVDWAYENAGASITAGQTALPVALVSFESQLKANDLRLTWRTASETSSAGFHVERSEDGKTFHSITWVEGNGNSTSPKDYYYDDKNLREGKTYYYRLRQVDYNGQFEFSPVLTVKVDRKGMLVGEFYPNPAAAGLVRLDFQAVEDAEWTAVVYDMAGKELLRGKYPINKGTNELQFDLTGFVGGTYFVKLENGVDRVYRKLVLE